MCILSPDNLPTNATDSAACPAQRLDAQQRLQLARETLAGVPVQQLAKKHGVSRKFVSQQVVYAHHALQKAFAPPQHPDDEVLFLLPVTRPWLRSFTLGLVLTCHSSFRGVQEIFRDFFDSHVALGTVHNVVHAAVAPARACNARQDLSGIAIAAHDEIFQAQQPVLVGADAASTYCYLLAQEPHRDADTWAVHMWDLQAQGFAPRSTIADVFHAERDFGQVVRFLENRAYQALTAADKLQRRAQRPKAASAPPRSALSVAGKPAG